MNLSNNGLWAALFRACLKAWNIFSGKPRWLCDPGHIQKTDFCTFTRTIFILAPLALAFNAVILLAAAGTLYLFAALLWANLSGLGIFLLIITAVIVCIALIVSLVFGTERIAKAVAKSETARIVNTFIAAKKSRFCPTITFSGGANANS